MGKNAHSKLPWADAPFLLSLARNKSFVAAADELGVDRTTVARRLDRLEAEFGSILFERPAGQLELSPEGRRIMSFIERAEQELSQLHSDQDTRRLGYGKVRISLSEHVLAAFAPQLDAFIADTPEVFLELTTSDRFVDLYKYEADIVLRIGKSAPEKLHSIDLGAVEFGLYQRAEQTEAVTKYWALPGQTEVPEQIRGAIAQAKIVAAIDGVIPTRDMILAGGGAGILPKFLGQGDPRLVPCSDNLPLGPYRLSMSCLPEQRNLHRIRIVMKNLSRSLDEAFGHSQRPWHG